jgi:hypothetical protein
MRVVFVGPSLHPGDRIPGAIERRPPAARGDVIAAAKEGVRIIGLVDGVFATRLAVSNGEIREAARIGARLFGAASIGALRAVECPDAMEGVGIVHRKFTTGELTDDDEVACLVDPETHEALGLPLVVIREGLRLAGITDQRLARFAPNLLRRMKDLPFDERTLRRLELEASRASVEPDDVARLVRAVRSPEADLKRADALELVRICAAAAAPS